MAQVHAVRTPLPFTFFVYFLVADISNFARSGWRTLAKLKIVYTPCWDNRIWLL